MLILEYVGQFMWVIRNIKEQCLTSPKVFYKIEEAEDWFMAWKSAFPSDISYNIRYGIAGEVYFR